MNNRKPYIPSNTALDLLCCNLNMVFIRMFYEERYQIDEEEKSLFLGIQSFFDSVLRGREIVRSGILNWTPLKDVYNYDRWLEVEKEVNEERLNFMPAKERYKRLESFSRLVGFLPETNPENYKLYKREIKGFNTYLRTLNEVVLEEDAEPPDRHTVITMGAMAS